MPTLEILTSRTGGFVAMHTAGFDLYRAALARELDVRSSTTVYASPGELPTRLRDSRADIVLVIADFGTPVETLRDAFVEARAASPARKLVFFDTFDGTNTPCLPLLPHVDAYLKSKSLCPVDRYTRDFQGGYVFTDYCARTLGWDLGGWHFGSTADPALLGKIVTGWSYGASRGLRWLCRLNRLVPSGFSRRPIQLHARITPPQREAKEWYERYRAFCAEAVGPLRTKYRTTPVDRVSRRAYLLEMRRCRLVLSPFGWGELCLRDYEAICSGCLLLKPDISHLRTSPDVFVPGETYVPLRWDLSDLGDACEKYLSDEKAAAGIARTAQDRLSRYYEHGGFVADVRRLLEALGIKNGTTIAR